jgi:hypothetical protein
MVMLDCGGGIYESANPSDVRRNKRWLYVVVACISTTRPKSTTGRSYDIQCYFNNKVFLDLVRSLASWRYVETFNLQ